MKKLFYIFILCIGFGIIKADAQTNVSGSIHANTTWTLSNSPYHVTSNIYVFPGVTLTINPGVKVIFDGDYTLEVRGKIIAKGNSSSSIYFCGNLIVENNDSFYVLWNKVLIEPNNKGTGEFEYCVFKDASSALSSAGTITKLKNCLFESNQIAIDGYGIYNSSLQTIDNCIFRYNAIGLQYSNSSILNACEFSNNGQGLYAVMQSRLNKCTFIKNQCGINIYNGSIYKSTFRENKFGIKAPNFDGAFMTKLDTIKGCTIEDNDIGIEDSADGAGRKIFIIDNSISYNRIGYKVLFAGDISGTFPAIVKNNKICSNSLYNIVNENNQNKNFTDNCFCTDDADVIEDKLYDGFDDPNLGLLTYNVYDDECKKKIKNNFKNLPVSDKDTGCLNFAECQTYTTIYKQQTFISDVVLYPNPVSTQLTINFDQNAEGIIHIYDQFGRLIHTQIMHSSNHGIVMVDVSSWQQGLYIVDTNSNGIRDVKSFIKL